MNNQLIVNNQLIALDNSGYLLHLEDWSALVCEELASREEIQLTDDHKEIIHLIQSFYNEYQLSPVNRVLTKYVALHAGIEKGNGLYLNALFKGQPAKIAAKLAGLPRPTNCL